MSRSTGVARRCPLLNEKVVPDYTNNALLTRFGVFVSNTLILLRVKMAIA